MSSGSVHQDASPAARARAGRRGSAARRPRRRARQGAGRRVVFAVAGLPGHPARGLGQRARQPQPVHRLLGLVLRGLPPQLRPAHRLRAQRRVGAGARRELDAPAPTARSGPSRSARASSGRTASRSRPATSPSPTTYIVDRTSSPPSPATPVTSRRRRPSTTRRSSSSAASPRRTCSACGSRSCPSTSGARSARSGRNTFQNNPPIVGSGPFQVSSTRRATTCAWSPTRTTGAAPPRSTRSSSQTYTNPDTMARTFKRRYRRLLRCARGAVRALKNEPGIKANRLRGQGLRRARLQLLHEGKSLGNPVLQDWKFRQALSGRSTRRRWSRCLQRLRRPPADDHRADFYTNPDWHWTPPADRPFSYDPEKAKQRSTPPATRTRTATAPRQAGQADQAAPLDAATRRAGQQVGKLIAGWFEDIGSRSSSQSWTTAP